jgi:hypothetical protein
VSPGSVFAERFSLQALAGAPLRDPVAVAERLLAIQGQDPRGARLAVRARTSGLSAADVDRALSADRSLLITWLNRGTLHLVRSEDYPWLHALTAPRLFTGNARRLGQEGVGPDDAERGVKAIERSLVEEGPLTRLQLRERLDAAGPMVGKQHAYVLVHDWLGPQKPVERAAALAELARRYLVGHGPADDRDLAKWAGLPLRDVRAGLNAIGSELEERAGGLVRLAKRPAAEEVPPPRLLGAFDPLLLGWAAREPIVGPYEHRIVSGGLFRPMALVEGQAAGIWKWVKGEVVLSPFDRFTAPVSEALERDAADVARFLA